MQQTENSEQVQPIASTSASSSENSVPSQIFGCNVLTYGLWCEFDNEADKDFQPKPSDI